jgi:ribulose-bisphosphate carboxylase large chain
VGTSLRVSYLVRAAAGEIAARADALMLEQTVELPRAALWDSAAADRVLGRIEEIEPAFQGQYRVAISYPLIATAHDPAQLLTVIFGNSSLQPDVVLADVELPEAAFDWLPGPRVGIPGLRALTGVAGRPLLATALKPMGLEPARLGELCRGFALAGLDLVKDDHGLADHPFCPFEARLHACIRGVEGTRTVYVPNLVGTPGRVARQLELARDAGARAVMISPMILGLPFLHQLASMAGGLPIIAHPSFGGVLRAGEPVLFGKLFRWYGADAVIFPHTGGRFGYGSEVCRELATFLRSPHPRMAASFPMPGGGIRIGRIEELLQFYGPDCILLIGSSLYERGQPFERARELVKRVTNASTDRQV